jgi:tellurite resistance protein
MSLFHKTHENAGPVTFTEKEAVLALWYLAVTADGHVAPEEEALVIAASNRMKLLRKQSNDEFNDTIAAVREAIEKCGRDGVIATASKALPADLRDPVYALAADIVFADGTAGPEEIDCLRKIQEALEIPDDLATKIVEVMRLKNRG